MENVELKNLVEDMAEVIGEGVREGSKELQGKNMSGVRWLSSQSSARLGRRNDKRSGGIPGAVGTVWEMAAASLHNDVFLDPDVPLRRCLR